jgi:hypothetical protein
MSHIVRNAIEVDLSEILRRKNIRLLTEGEWMYLANPACERYFLRKIRRGESQRFYTRFVARQTRYRQALA